MGFIGYGDVFDDFGREVCQFAQVPKSMAIVLLYRTPLQGVICQLTEALLSVVL